MCELNGRSDRRLGACECTPTEQSILKAADLKGDAPLLNIPKRPLSEALLGG
ncbi:hypothetical protein GCM10010339_69110 [Streptomyces alanosinicus]|uniref:Uncharacterized protein n=1 Tax=Streptomyces alanosinicus TaxID=68171 RepID=A0A919D553_9ACTN|nr:hypothetical protein GCM10010339_69110 [Streptomyces alanosinicus]